MFDIEKLKMIVLESLKYIRVIWMNSLRKERLINMNVGWVMGSQMKLN